MSPARPLSPKVRQLRGLKPKDLNPLLPDLSTAPKPPTWLSAGAKREWKRIVSETAKHKGWLQIVDRAALAAYCSTWAVFEEAAKDVAKRGALVPGRSSADQASGALVKNPSIQIMRDAGAQMRGWVKELGFTPDARGRIDIAPESTPENERVNDLLS